MNVSVLVKSLEYLKKFDLISSLSIWVNQELTNIKYKDSKFVRSIKKWDYDITEILIVLVKNKKIFQRLRYQNHSGYNFKLLKLLIDFKIMTYKDSELLNSCNDNNLEMTKLLIDKGAKINSYNNTILKDSCCYGHIGIVQLLLDHWTDDDIHKDHALINASYFGHIEIVRLLLSKGVNINNYNGEPLISASRKGHIEIVQLLLDHGANVHANNDQALRSAKINHHWEVVKILEAHMQK